MLQCYNIPKATTVCRNDHCSQILRLIRKKAVHNAVVQFFYRFLKHFLFQLVEESLDKFERNEIERFTDTSNPTETETKERAVEKTIYSKCVRT